jgi:anti-sigma regulatory factor (Ser/Thr protein kinase)
VPRARRRLRQTLAGAGIEPERQHEAVLLLSELVTNAVEHGSGTGDRIALAWTLDRDVLKVAVSDAARRSDPLGVGPADAEREKGRGLRIVDRLAESWTDRVAGRSRLVSFRLHL